MKVTPNFFILGGILSLIIGIIYKLFNFYCQIELALRPQTFLLAANTCWVVAALIILKSKEK